MGLYLVASLRGTAQEVLGNLDGRERMEFYCLAPLMEQRFDLENQEELFRAELKGRVRKSKESIPQLAHEIRRLAKRAYPNDAHAILETLTKDHFLDALLDPEMCWKIFQSCPLTLNDAMGTALELETRIAEKCE